jgi:transmembrane 9 superfamily member 2/4
LRRPIVTGAKTPTLTQFDLIMRLSILSCIAALAAAPAHAFYLPGLAPSSFDKNDVVPLTVNRLTPSLSRHDEQIHAVVGYDYYHPAFRFCRPEGGPKWVRESLGSIIFGDRIRTSPFELHMAQNETCKSLCAGREFDERAAKFVNSRIEQAYNVNFLIDGLPAAELHQDPYTGEIYSSPGFPLGTVKEDGTKVLFNHWDIIVDYHEAGFRGGRYRVVGVLVDPRSDADAKYLSEGKAECGAGREVVLNENGNTQVAYTYSIYWRKSPTAWATRWDKYLHVEDPKIHWFSLINSTIFVVFLLGMVSTILVRALRKDIARYNRLDNINLDDLSGTSAVGEDDIQEDSGWKLVHGDVFRSPRNGMLLSMFLGNGAQLFFMVGFTVLFAMLGFLSPSNRGFLTTVGLLLYTLFGFVGGYVSARAYKTFGGENWKVNIAATPALVPGIVFGTFFLMNLFVWMKGSSGAVPLSTMLAIIGIWFVISVPLSVAGSWLGFKHPGIEPPTRVNQIPRQIPQVSRSLRLWPSILMTGVLPFCAIFVELYFIMTSLWTSKIYYMFGFLFICYGLMLLTSACTTVLLVYFMLCAEDYRWQWRAFIGAGMTGGYVFLNALGFWAMKISFGGLTGTVLYIGYSALIGFLVFLLSGKFRPCSNACDAWLHTDTTAGTVGFLMSFAFTHRIYSSIKID